LKESLIHQALVELQSGQKESSNKKKVKDLSLEVDFSKSFPEKNLPPLILECHRMFTF
jgi:hypothetical protein